MATVSIMVPHRIRLRWRKYNNLSPVGRRQYTLSRVLKMAKISAEEFKKSWSYVHPRLSDDDLFSLFKDSGFSPTRAELSRRVAFARNVTQQYKDMTRPTKAQNACLICVCLMTANTSLMDMILNKLRDLYKISNLNLEIRCTLGIQSCVVTRKHNQLLTLINQTCPH